MEYKRFNNKIVLRIDKDEEILEKLKEVALKENIKLASISALGATNDFTVGVYKVDEKKYIADGDVNLGDLNEELGINLESENIFEIGATKNVTVMGKNQNGILGHLEVKLHDVGIHANDALDGGD